MTIPVPSAKYNLLQDLSTENRRFKKSTCLSIVLVLILMIPLILLFAYCFYAIYIFEADDREAFTNRAELYSLDEYLNKQTPCKLCNSHPNVIYESNANEPSKIVCYYNFPSSESDPIALMPDNIDCNLCTHINIGFASIRNCTIVLSDVMRNVTTQIVKLKSCNPRLKILLSLGGASNDEGFPEMVLTHASRKVFIRSLKSVLRQYQLDGVDLDWEFPVFGAAYNNHSDIGEGNVNGRQRQHFSQLLREIRSEYIREKRDYLLTVAVAAPENIVNLAYDVDQMNLYVDFVNLMSYDYHFYTKLTAFTGINAPLYSKKDEIFYLATLNINYSANLWLSKGMDRNKIVVGLPTYGHTFTLVNKHNGLIGSPASGYGKLGNLGFVDYPDICEFIKNNTNVNVVYDNQTFSPYLHKDHEWVSYEDKESIVGKAKYVKDSMFGGVMIYSLNSDDYSGHCSTDSDEKFYLTRQLKDIFLDDDL